MKKLQTRTMFWVGVGLAFTLIGAVGAWFRYRQANVLEVWKPFIITQHQFDYELGFVKRGLVGEAFRLSGVPRTIAGISTFSWVVLAALAALLVRFHRRNSTDAITAAAAPPAWLWAVFVSPAVFLQAGGDFGRLDPVLLVLEVGLLLTVTARGWGWTLVALSLSLIGVATHELFLLAQLPFVAAVHVFVGWHRIDRRRELWGRAMTLAIGAGIAAAAIAAFGRMDGISPTEYMAFLQQHRGIEQPSEEGIAVLYNSLGANSRFAWEKLAAKSPGGIPCVAAAMLVYLGLSLGAARWQKTSVLLIVAGAVSPLLLLVLAYDYGRWFSFAAVNILLAVSVCQVNERAEINWRLVRWTCLLSLLGPFGVTIGFPWYRS